MPSFTTRFEATACWRCGVSFALPLDFIQRRMVDNRPVYCPNRHANHFGNAKPAVVVQAELAARRAKVQLLHEREQAEARKLDATKQDA